MRKTGLEFAPGTKEDCKRVVGRMFPDPADLLGAYREAREQFDNSDIVLAASDQMPGIVYSTRIDYCKHLRKVFGERAAEFKMWSYSAQSITRMPIESSAFWLVIDLAGADLPIMCVIFAVPYEVSDHVEAPRILQ